MRNAVRGTPLGGALQWLLAPVFVRLLPRLPIPLLTFRSTSSQPGIHQAGCCAQSQNHQRIKDESLKGRDTLLEAQSYDS